MSRSKRYLSVFCSVVWSVCASLPAHGRSRLTRLHDLPEAHFKEGDVIPHLLHQSWKTPTLPSAAHEAWRQSWLEQNPSWRVVLWTDEQNRALVQNHFPWLLAFYDTLEGVYRADLVRPLYMHLYGGVYADIDFVALRPFDELLQRQSQDVHLILGQDCGWLIDRSKSKREQVCSEYDQSIPNAFMASTPKHPFWSYVIIQILKAASVPNTEWENPAVITGPKPLFHALQQYNQHAADNGLHTDVEVLLDEVYPLSWTEHDVDLGCCFVWDSNTLNVDCCRDMFPNSWVMTFWSATWQQ
ncbi:hypothetical protein ABBQ32_008850 [Trebouxia sp. C0010 RCD-2024]